MIIYKKKLQELKLKMVATEYNRIKISNYNVLYNAIYPLFDHDTIGYKEEVIVMYLNRSNNNIGFSKHSMGGMNHSIIDIRVIAVEALKCGASAVALAHNHPSGSLEPSDSDRTITKKLKEALKLLQIDVLDHIIVSPEKDNCYSFLENDLL